MNINVWDLNDGMKPLKISHSEHTEFAVGVDFNLYNKRLVFYKHPLLIKLNLLFRQVASCGWDGRLLVWNWDQKQPKII